MPSSDHHVCNKNTHQCTCSSLGSCRIPGYPTDQSVGYDRKIYHWKRQTKDFVRYALPTKLSRCNDNASPLPSGLRHLLRNRVRLCQDWQLLCLSFYCRVPGYPTVTGIGYPVPKISVNARAYVVPMAICLWHDMWLVKLESIII